MVKSLSVDEFAHVLMERVRDQAIDSCDQLARGAVGGVIGARWRARVDSPATREAVTELIPDVVDQVLFYLLDAIDNGQLPLAWRRLGEFEDLTDGGLGEMAGWLMCGDGGWIDQYSKRRLFDDFAGLGDAP